jgi:hypothetical protein
MENSSRRYKITNTTIKEPRLGPAGKDQRKLQEKNGYVVQFRDEIGNIRRVTPEKWGGNPVMVTTLSEGLYDMFNKGLIDIVETDISQALKRHTLTKKSEGDAVVPEPVKVAAAGEKKRASAAEMGEVLSEKAKEIAYGSATNPDGPDNFTVTASKKKKSKDF